MTRRLLCTVAFLALFVCTGHSQTVQFSLAWDLYPSTSSADMLALYRYVAILDGTDTDLTPTCASGSTGCLAPLGAFPGSTTHVVSLKVACRSTPTLFGQRTPPLTFTVGDPLPPPEVTPLPPPNPCLPSSPPVPQPISLQLDDPVQGLTVTTATMNVEVTFAGLTASQVSVQVTSVATGEIKAPPIVVRASNATWVGFNVTVSGLLNGQYDVSASGGGLSTPPRRVTIASGIAPPPPPPSPPPINPCVANPLVITGVSWPSSAEGSRQLRYTASVAGLTTTVANVELTFIPRRLSVTDARGCRAVVQ